ncbi:Pyruvate kinase [Novosphingobium nitrogenifigens DSM 19370]|uniref:Pyruvate kinase n=1 Tax=Novosphingobium nitrogenifigens DSM 19370 TaxID=983920 RepID=F1Z9N1_9SPHN|nr:pyruvate kinase [Novosphingobium nitrogenifigens]EGD58711.1 Pyruvate kinase [Novosphingobium nitrogenifigens DSM 19370]
MSDPTTLLTQIDALIDNVERDSHAILARWEPWDIRPDFKASAENLAAYLALRRHDLRELQRALMPLGLSSLGRLESRVMPALRAVRHALAVLAGDQDEGAVTAATFFEGEERLETRAQALFGAVHHNRLAAMMVTCPSEAAEEPDFFAHLNERGIEALRINCAHDTPERWAAMITNARSAQTDERPPFAIFMDLAGPKLRTGEIRARGKTTRLHDGDLIAVVAPDAIETKVPATPWGKVDFTIACTLPEAIAAARAGERLLIDDGRIACTILDADGATLIARVDRTRAKGMKPKPEKGINLPDTDLSIPALTPADREALPFVAAHADGIDYSFVQTAEDVATLQAELAHLRPDDWNTIALVLKIETARAVQHLPDIIVRAAARQPIAVMIARGDLAIEIGFARLAEMQEEILWIAEAAQVPVIWATQVMEHLVKEGMPNRGELTDAAMAARAECVMLNKGPFLLEALDWLDVLLARMEDHVHKKTPQLRRLRSWG